MFFFCQALMFLLLVACCISLDDNIKNNTWYYEIDCYSAGFKELYEIPIGSVQTDYLSCCKQININLINLQSYLYGNDKRLNLYTDYNFLSLTTKEFYKETLDVITKLAKEGNLTYVKTIFVGSYEVVNQHGQLLVNLFTIITRYIYETIINHSFNINKWIQFDKNNLMLLNCEQAPDKIQKNSICTINNPGIYCEEINSNIQILVMEYMVHPTNTQEMIKYFNQNLYNKAVDSLNSYIVNKEWTPIQDCDNVLFDYDDCEFAPTDNDVSISWCKAFNYAVENNLNKYGVLYKHDYLFKESDKNIQQLNNTINEQIEQLNMKIEELSKQEDKPSETPIQQPDKTPSVEQIIKPIEVNDNHVSKLSFNIWNSILTVFVGLIYVGIIGVIIIMRLSPEIIERRLHKKSQLTDEEKQVYEDNI